MDNPKFKRDIRTLFFYNSHLLYLTVTVLLIAGLASLAGLPRLEDPRITTRNATVLTYLPGASAARIEALINEKIEDALEEIEEIKTIESLARPNVSSISIELVDATTQETNETVFAKIRSRLQDVNAELPIGASQPVLDTNRGVTAYTLIFGVYWAGEGAPPLNLLNRVTLDLKDRMLTAGQTELVRVFGTVQEEIRVIPDPAELALLNLTPQILSTKIRESDVKVSAGRWRGSDQDFQIEVEGGLDGIDRIANIPVLTQPDGTTLRMGDVARVERGYRDPVEQTGLRNNQRIMYVGVRASEEVRIDTWTAEALQVFDQFKAEYSEPIGLDLIFQQDEYTEARLTDLLINLLLGAALVVGIVFLTLGWRSALVISSVLPLTAAGCLFAFNFTGQSIHQMSIFGMIIAIGLLIDSAIVMTDEIRKGIQLRGLSQAEAMSAAIKHLFVPLLASTLTTILGFMPIFLLPGNAGDFVSPIAISVVLALILSFFLAVTVIPALAARSTQPLAGDRRRWWREGVPAPAPLLDFRVVTGICLSHPKRAALILISLPVLGFALVSTMKVEFFPAADRNMFEAQLFLPSTSSMAFSENQVEIADQLIRNTEGITDLHWLIGASTPSVYYNQIPRQDNNSAFAQAVITASSSDGVPELVREIQTQLNEALPDARSVVQMFAQGPPAEAPVAFRILGPDIDGLRTLGERVRGVMHQHPQITQTRASMEGGQAKLWFTADEVEATRANLSLGQIAGQFNAGLEGTRNGSVLEDVEELPVRVQLQDERTDLERAANFILVNGNKWIPAQALGDLDLRPEISAITRYNGQRVNTLFAYLTPDAKAVSVSQELVDAINTQLEIPAQYRIEVAGESEQQSDAVGGLATFAPVLLVIMMATLILTFRSLALAGIVFLVGGLSVGLGLLSLKIAGYPLGFNPMIGSIGLAGVAINGTIVVLAAIRANERAKNGDPEAIIDEVYGCGRHLLSTTLTTLAGFIPLLLFSGGSFWPPLAVVIAGGIAFSLMLTLFLTPVAYKLITDFGKRGRAQPFQDAQLSRSRTEPQI